MKSIFRPALLSALATLLAPTLHAQIANFTCQASNGATLSGPAFYFLIETSVTDGIPILFADVYTDYTLLPQLLAAEKASTSYNCTLGNGSAQVSIGSAVVDGVDASAAGAGITSTNAQVYASAIFAFTSITSGSVTFSPTGATIPADQKAKVLAALQARAQANFAGKPAGPQ